jgi:YegS/Rv2252/BmrU family lipid kinase
MGDAATAIGVIVNPRAGLGRGLRLLPRLAATLQTVSETSHLHVTAARGEATTVARELALAGARLVVAVGGDGTVNEVANGLLAAGRPEVALGIVAAGRGVDFARTLGIEDDPAAALLAACRGAALPLDAVEADFAGERRFLVNAGGMGLDAAVAARAERTRLPGRRSSYWAALGAVLPRFRPFAVEVEADGERFAGKALTVVVANGASFGGGFELLPHARLDDGLFDLAVVGDLSAFDLLRHLPRLADGGHLDHPKFWYRTARAARVAFPGGDRPRLQLDGEVVDTGRAGVAFALHPGALRVSK